MKAKKGFTLVELLLVVLIISVLASIVVPRMSGASDGAKIAKCDAAYISLVKALELYAVDNNGKYPRDTATFKTDISLNKKYFPHGEPLCPFYKYWTYYAQGDNPGTIAKHDHSK